MPSPKNCRKSQRHRRPEPSAQQRPEHPERRASPDNRGSSLRRDNRECPECPDSPARRQPARSAFPLAHHSTTRLPPRLADSCRGRDGRRARACRPHQVFPRIIYPNVPAFAAFQGVNAAAALTPDAVTATAATATPAAEPAVSAWTRNAPFTATLSTRQKITSRNAEKDVQHIEIDLEGSGIQYQPGDALGVWPVNAPALVSEILDRHKLDGTETVKLADGSEASLRDALTHHADITQNTPTLVEQYAALSKLRPLQELVEDRKALDALLATTPPVGLFAEYPHPLPAQQLFSLFRPQSPRLYSIASAQDEVGDAVHLTVGVVHLRHHGQHYMGAASGYLGHLLEEDDDVRVFIEPNRNFRLPAGDDTPHHHDRRRHGRGPVPGLHAAAGCRGCHRKELADFR